MDFVYICRPGENEELRYSIRSVIKNTNASSIWLIGGKPEWYSGNHIETIQLQDKFKNTQNSLMTICNNKDISKDFVLMNDDFFIINKNNTISSYYDGTLDQKITAYSSRFGNNQYTKILADTRNKLIKRGISSPLNYDMHVPMVMNKEKLESVIDISLSPRSFYGNIYNIGGEKIKDVKIYKKEKDFDRSSYFLSTNDDSFQNVKNILEDLFPEKSIYEKVLVKKT